MEEEREEEEVEEEERVEVVKRKKGGREKKKKGRVVLEEVNLSRDKEVILSNEVEGERKEEEEGWADKAMTSVYGIMSYLGGAVVGSEKGAGSLQQVQGRRLVGDGRGAQGKQRTRVVKKKGSGVGKRGERWGGCKGDFADGAANLGRESHEDGRIRGWMGDSSRGVQHSTAIYSILPV